MGKKEKIKKMFNKSFLDAFIIVFVIAMGLFLHWKIYEVVTFSFFIWIIINPLPSRYLVSVAIFFLILTPIFLVGGNIIIADQLAIYAYYFLIMTVMMGIYEIWQEDDKKKDELK